MEPRPLRSHGAPADPYQVSDIIWSVSVVLVIGLGMILSMLAGWRWFPDPESVGPQRPTTMVVTNARVWTSKGWASAFAVQDNRFVYVGDEAGLKHWISKDTRVIDGGGKTMVTPGLFDSHVHLVDAGIGLSSIQLHDVTSKDEFVSRVRDFAATKKPGQWIIAGDWDNTFWGGELPRLDWIDAVTPANPVWVCRVDGHMCLANSLTLRAANITAATPAPAGGEFVYDDAGKLTGILKDNAMDLVTLVIPPMSDEELDSAVDAAIAVLLRNGITSVHHMGAWDNVAPFKRARASGRLRVRVKASLPLATWAQVADMAAKDGAGDSWLRFTGVKGFADGSLGSLTALMFSPYGTPPSTGLQTTSTEDLYAWVKAADGAGLQPCIHAIGDKGNSITLDVFERVIRENEARGDARRFRIEHAQHIQPSDFARFAELGVVASVQPYHLIDDGRWAEQLIGSYRAATSYPFRSFRDAGVRFAAGSDWSVAPAEPLMGVYAAVTRATLDGAHPDGWYPAQKITVEEALRAYTVDAAYADFEEAQLGAIAVGMLADFTVLSSDITAGPAEDIPKARVLMTVVDGKVMYEAPAKA